MFYSKKEIYCVLDSKQYIFKVKKLSFCQESKQSTECHFTVEMRLQNNTITQYKSFKNLQL